MFDETKVEKLQRVEIKTKFDSVKRIFFLTSLIFMSANSFCQDNYEIQVYPSQTVDSGITMTELHSNFTPVGQAFSNGVRPTQSAFHETAEITHGFTSCFEIGFYVFTNIHSAYGWQWVGDHIRPRVRAPEKWKLPVGLSLSGEFGYQRKEYSADTWTMELRPILDKKFSWGYISLNPVLGKSFHGENEQKGFEFEPNLKFSVHAGKKIDVGFEYYGTTGSVLHSDSLHAQQHALFATIDLNISPEWEFNAGAGWGLTKSTDGFVAKIIVGRRFGNKK